MVMGMGPDAVAVDLLPAVSYNYGCHHCEAQRAEAIENPCSALDCSASLAMTPATKLK
jgi:hypothetical protein